MCFKTPNRQSWPGARTAWRCFLLAALAAACTAAPRATPSATPVPASATALPSPLPATPTADRWQELLQHEPYPFTTPLPPSEGTAIDGLYVKIDPKPGTPVPCVRCPDWAPEGGLWKLLLDKGVFRIYHAATGWRSVGTYTVTGDKLALFNDPVCQAETGWYTWALTGGELVLAEVDDPCGIHLRAQNLTQQPWQSCQPPNTEAAVSGHWPVPDGCDPERE